MKNILSILCGIVICGSCTKESIIDNSNGTKLISINYKDNNGAIDSWQELFSYNNDGVIEKIENQYSLGTRYEMEYNNDGLQEYSTFTISDDKIVSRDSIAYNNNGTIRAIYNFEAYLQENLELTQICEYEYSSQNRVTEKKNYDVNREQYTSYQKYYWNNKNIEKSEFYNDDDILRYEIKFSYDNKNNYRKDIPIYISDPISWSENNIIESNFTDYTGAIDLSCYTCITRYRYNKDLFPTYIANDSGVELSLTYE